MSVPLVAWSDETLLVVAGLFGVVWIVGLVVGYWLFEDWRVIAYWP